jgi:hypothetical protein
MLYLITTDSCITEIQIRIKQKTRAIYINIIHHIKASFVWSTLLLIRAKTSEIRIAKIGMTLDIIRNA